jgi:hypothetical protein
LIHNKKENPMIQKLKLLFLKIATEYRLRKAIRILVKSVRKKNLDSKMVRDELMRRAARESMGGINE